LKRFTTEITENTEFFKDITAEFAEYAEFFLKVFSALSAFSAVNPSAHDWS
jgi:hypothetical protein